MKNYSLEELSKGSWSFILIKNNTILYKSKKQGLSPLLFCLKNKKGVLKRAVVYDKIVGRAAALLMIYGQVKSVLTPVASRSAMKLLGRYNTPLEYQKIIKRILNKKRDDQCPMEKLSYKKSASAFFHLINEKLKKHPY